MISNFGCSLIGNPPVSEINMRRGFLDKRSCIETTFKLKYEKEQEVSISMGFLDRKFLKKPTEINIGSWRMIRLP